MAAPRGHRSFIYGLTLGYTSLLLHEHLNITACSGDPDLEEANLAPADAAVKDEGSSIPSTVFNLTNTIIGAGEYTANVLLLIFPHSMPVTT